MRYKTNQIELKEIESFMKQSSKNNTGYIIWLDSDKAVTKGLPPLEELKPQTVITIEMIQDLMGGDSNNQDNDELEDEVEEDVDKIYSNRDINKRSQESVSLRQRAMRIVKAAKSVLKNVSSTRFSTSQFAGIISCSILKIAVIVIKYKLFITYCMKHNFCCIL